MSADSWMLQGLDPEGKGGVWFPVPSTQRLEVVEEGWSRLPQVVSWPWALSLSFLPPSQVLSSSPCAQSCPSSLLRFSYSLERRKFLFPAANLIWSYPPSGSGCRTLRLPGGCWRGSMSSLAH